MAANPPRPLRREQTDRWIAGVLGGIARYFELDPTRLRLIFLIVSILSTAIPGIIIYLALWILIPQGPLRNN